MTGKGVQGQGKIAGPREGRESVERPPGRGCDPGAKEAASRQSWESRHLGFLSSLFGPSAGAPVTMGLNPVGAHRLKELSNAVCASQPCRAGRGGGRADRGRWAWTDDQSKCGTTTF